MQALEQLLRAKISPAAKLVALHLAGKLPVSDDLATMVPRAEALLLNLSRGEYERAWRECVRIGWVDGPTPVRVGLKPDALPRRALSQPPTTTEPKNERREEPTRDHRQTPAAVVRGRDIQGLRRQGSL